MSPTVPTNVKRTTQLGPAARLLWRSQHAIQLELGNRRVMVDPIAPSAVRALLGADGAPCAGPVAELQADLLAAGFLWPSDPVVDDGRRRPPHPRLAGELAALSAEHGGRAGEVLQARAQYTVAIHGGGRVGAHIASILAAAGVGRVHALDSGPVRLHQLAPGGLRPADEGTRLDEATAAAVLRAAPEADTTPPPLGDRPDLVILAVDQPVEAERRDALHARGCAHLVVALGAEHGVAGPLVLPGLTSCLNCADQHRKDRDPAWNALAVQLSLPHRSAAASQVALAAFISGLAAMEALAFLDGGQPATIEGTLETQPPDVRVRRRSWPPHPDCGCMAG